MVVVGEKLSGFAVYVHARLAQYLVVKQKCDVVYDYVPSIVLQT